MPSAPSPSTPGTLIPYFHPSPSPPPTLPGAPSQEVAQLPLHARVCLFHPYPCRHRAWHQAGGQGPECSLFCQQRASRPVYSLGQVGALRQADSRVLLSPKPTSLVLAIHPSYREWDKLPGPWPVWFCHLLHRVFAPLAPRLFQPSRRPAIQGNLINSQQPKRGNRCLVIRFTDSRICLK